MLPLPALAALRCGPFDGRGVQLCEVGIPNLTMPTVRQRCPQWCWAACIEAIFALHGHPVPQEAIVHRLFGGLVCRPVPGPGIVRAVDGAWRDASGTRFGAEAEVLWDAQYGFGRPDAAAEAARELAEGNPLINGALGHATVLTAMTYARDAAGRGQPLQIVVRDPWPLNPNRRVLGPQEAMGTMFLAKVRVFA